jgi:ABC-type microcin C transport system permease subunit YejB
MIRRSGPSFLKNDAFINNDVPVLLNLVLFCRLLHWIVSVPLSVCPLQHCNLVMTDLSQQILLQQLLAILGLPKNRNINHIVVIIVYPSICLLV